MSYFEWVQNRSGLAWDEATVDARLADVMRKSYADVQTLATQHQQSLRTAAYMLGVGRVAAVQKLRGLYA